MENLSIKTTGYTENTNNNQGNRGKGATLAGLATSFREMVGKAGIHIDSGFDALTGRTGVSALGESNNPALQEDDYRPDVNRDNVERDDAADRGPREGYDDKRADSGQADRNDNSDDSRTSDQGDRHADDSSDDQSNQGEASSAQDDTGSDGDTESNDGTESETAANDEGAADENNGEGAAEDGSETAADSDGENGETVSAGTDGAGTPTVAAAATGAMAAELLVGGTAHTEAGKASDTGKEAALSGLTAAAKATTKRSDNHSGPSNQGQAAQQGANQIAHQAQNLTEAANATGTTVQQQAAELAKQAGPGERLQVAVNVTRESETVVSKPTSTLTANSVIASDGKTQSKAGQQTTSNHTGAAVAGQTQAAAAQAQNQQSAQGSANMQSGGDVKGITTTATTAGNTGGATQSAGGEATASTSSTSNGAAQQAQEARQSTQAQAQAQTANKPTLPGQSIVDQVSVKITKALQAGTDKITVQLRPAELGRVEVKMELTVDGRAMAVVTADNKDTMDLLRRDSGDLQRALQDAGLDVNSGDLSFNLRGQEGENTDNEDSNKGNSGLELAENDQAEDAMSEPLAAHEMGVLANGRIDVRA